MFCVIGFFVNFASIWLINHSKLYLLNKLYVEISFLYFRRFFIYLDMKTIYKYIVLVAVLISMASCDRIEILSPPGPRGLSAYEVWVEAVQNKTIQWENGTDLANYFKYLKGAKGDSGKDAFSIWQDWIRDGSVDNPHKPGEKWNPEKNTKRDFYLFLTGAKGDKGDTPFINSKGNWQIGDKDTGIPARGKDGKKGDKGDKGNQGQKGDKGDKGNSGDKGDKGNDGSSGAPGDKVEIIDGYWYINGINTGVSAVGEKGESGKGKSAYEIWVEEVEKGTIFDKDGNVWNKNNKSMAHFMLYMKGEKGGPGEVKVTKLSILSVIPGDPMIGVVAPPEEPEPPHDDPEYPGHPSQPTLIEVQSDPNATIYYQAIGLEGYYGGGGPTSNIEVYQKPADGEGKATISIDTFENTFIVNIWALSEGKAYSPNLLVRVTIFMPT